MVATNLWRIALIFTLCLLLICTYRWLIQPSEILPQHADAIVVLSGGRGERLPHAIKLMETGLADELVISVGGDLWTPHAVRAIKAICKDPAPPFKISCHKADPDSTQGEAITFATLAKKQGWSKIIVVTSDYHLFRAMRWFDRCFAGGIYGSPAKSDKTVQLISHEWLGLIAFVTVQRSCQRRDS